MNHSDVFASASGSKSKLAPEVQELVRLIFDVERMKQDLIEFEIDLKKMPLGKLSKSQIKAGYQILNEALVSSSFTFPLSQSPMVHVNPLARPPHLTSPHLTSTRITSNLTIRSPVPPPAISPTQLTHPPRQLNLALVHSPFTSFYLNVESDRRVACRRFHSHPRRHESLLYDNSSRFWTQQSAHARQRRHHRVQNANARLAHGYGNCLQFAEIRR